MVHKYRVIYPLLIACWICFSESIFAEIYKRQDNNGRISYSDSRRSDARLLKISPGNSFYRVKYVYDGDTVKLENGMKVRLLGINAPEIEGRYKEGEPGGEAARLLLVQFLSEKKIRLVRDVVKKDKYGRILAYIFTEDGIHINQEMVRAGWAAVTIFPPNLNYSKQLLDEQTQAESAGRGIWGLPHYTPKPFETIQGKREKGWKRLTGKVSKLRYTKKNIYLEFSDYFNVKIKRIYEELFPDFAAYQGREVEIRGWLSRRKNRYSMAIRHPSTIKLIK